jgi:hypothetical protein
MKPIELRRSGLLALLDYAHDRLKGLMYKRYTSSDEDAEVLKLLVLVHKAEGVAYGKIFVDVEWDSTEGDDDPIHDLVKSWNTGVEDDFNNVMDAGFEERGGKNCQVFQGPMHKLEELARNFKELPGKVFVEVVEL